ncbi:SAV_2336 N-terminal domain-related protein [Archangium violaceum]|uniref:TIR domain-containing protein n=1 Tax=Archangium violaceum Cb vi76 TaxID=1406225 RepID=A0A084SN38_9BACT|nr:SAV_2336 N-terminal domain-related protein [Archangium violaceum]KFA89873.1 hypothetical protein Q664_31980 [Archangium violaceum Cb vi76]
MIDRLLRVLEAANLDVTAEELADALWLATVLPKGVRPAFSLPSEPAASEQETAVEVPPNAPTSQEPTVATSATASTPPSALVVLPDEQRLSIPTVPLQVPAATALPHALEISRALRPLHRRVPSRTVRLVDEATSAEQIAETRVWTPVLRPALTRWLDLALVVDASASMAIWRQTVAEFRDLLMFQGGFRTVRTWHLPTSSGEGRLRLLAGVGADGRPLVGSDPQELNDPSGRRLVMVVSDCVSPGWYTGEVPELLASWGRAGPVVVVQMLSERHWSRTALRGGSAVLLRASRRGTPNSQFLVTRLSRRARQPAPAAPVVPVVTLEKASLGAWAKLVAGGDTSVLGFELHRARTLPPAMSLEGPSPSALERVQRFHATASAPARKLAGLLAAVPVSLPVMRLVRETMVPEARQEDLAEVFLGGLLRELPEQDASMDPEQKQYDFWPGVRDLLLDAVPAGSARTVLLRVSDFIESRLGHQTRDFPALLVDPTKDATAFAQRHRGFATIAAHVLLRMGGAYAQFAQRLTPHESSSRHGTVRIDFHQAYRELQVRIFDKASQVVATGRTGGESLSLVLSYGRYSVELPLLQRRWELEVNEDSVSIRLDWSLSGRQVLVAGTASHELSRSEVWTSEALGDLLARAGHGLLTGGQRGVDHVVARAYVARLRESGITSIDALVHVMTEHSRPDFDQGQVIEVPLGRSDIDETLRRADAVVLIGGGTGTFEVYRRARTAGMVVLPLRATGGAAAQAFEHLWAASPRDVRPGLEPFRERLGSSAEARVRAERVIAYLHAALNPRTTHRWVWLPEEVATRLRQLGREYEQLREQYPAGLERTRLMNEFVGRVVAQAGSYPLPAADELARTMKGAGPGDRIVLLGLMLVHTGPSSFEALIDILAQSLSPFEQYTALRVVGEMLRYLGRKQLKQLSDTLMELRATNALQINEDDTRASPLTTYLASILRMELLSPREEVETSGASEEFEREELIRIVREQLPDVERDIVNALPGLLVGQAFTQSHFQEDPPEGTISAIGRVHVEVNFSSIQRMGATAATLTARCLLENAAVELTYPDSSGRTSASRSLSVLVEVDLELEPHDDAPASISGVFINEVRGIEVRDEPAEEQSKESSAADDAPPHEQELILTGAQTQELQQALLSAFRSNNQLTQMVLYRLGLNLAAIVSPGPLASVVFQLIQWAEAHGRLRELVAGALVDNPGNRTLRDCAVWLGLSSPPAPGTTATPVTPLAPAASPERTKNKPPELFYAYSRKDEKLRGFLETHLARLKRQGVIKEWHDQRLSAGQEWKTEVLAHIEHADVILLLVSADFLASDFLDSTEMQRTLDREAAGEALVIPIILRPCDWKDAPFSKLQALPRDAKPVTSWGNREMAFGNIEHGIQTAIANWKRQR